MRKRWMAFIFSLCSFFLYGQKSDSYDIGNNFIPAGYMGCMGQIRQNDSCIVNPHSKPTCYKVSFIGSCDDNWAGVYWTNTADNRGANWGQYPGINLSSSGYTKITFWARGERGGEVVEFGFGGIDFITIDTKFRFKDSTPKTELYINMTKNWRQFTIDLKNKDLSSVIGGFYWSSNCYLNPSGLIFYLDDILLEK